jgi:phospholipase D1/2
MSLFREGHNCWKTSPASRVAVLIDAEDYFRALHWAFERASTSIFILGWDVDSRIQLVPEDRRTLAEFLLSLVEQKPDLQIHILSWDFVVLYADEREGKRKAQQRFGSHPRIHFRFDPGGPFLVSLHQKLVVVDDQLGFCGGLDITQRRWDTRHHLVHHPFRRDPDGKTYGTFHDVEMAVMGPAARELREICNDRWRTLTGKIPETLPARENPALWPAGVEPILTDHPVAIARTYPESREWREIRENRQLFLDLIREARHSIFAENQYFTSKDVGDALEARLREDDPPEIVILVREESSKWLEQLGVPAMRARLIRRLKQADHRGRLTVLCPVASQKSGHCINLHSKVFVVDDRYLRIGSSNLNARSEGMDAECDLAVEGRTPDERRAIQSVRDRLLAEHLGVSEEEFAAEFARDRSLIQAVNRLKGQNDRTLGDCPSRHRAIIEWLTPDTDIVDPPGPARLRAALRRLGMKVAGAAALIALFPVLRNALRTENLHAIATWVQATPFSSAGMAALFALLTFCGFPLVPLAILFSLVLPPAETFGATMAGAIVSATLLYRFSRARAERRDGWFNRVRESDAFAGLKRGIERQGIWPILLLRFTPVAPYWLVNVCMGLLGIRYGYFLLSTVLGLLPGFVLIAIFEERIASQQGLLQRIVILLAALTLLGWAIQKGVERFSKKREAYAFSR